MTNGVATGIATSQLVIAIVSIGAVTLLAYRGVVDGAAAVATILAVTGVTSGTSAVVRSHSAAPIPHDGETHSAK